VDNSLLDELQETLNEAQRLGISIRREILREEEQAASEARQRKKEAAELREKIEVAKKESEFWRTELVALEDGFGKQFNSLSKPQQEVTARRVLCDLDFAKWQREPSEPLYRHALLTGLLREDSPDIPKEGSRGNTG
jgi:hypothetical protein